MAHVIKDMCCVKGVDELNYRYYMHDMRNDLKYAKTLDYKTRETILSFIIPEQAFQMNKDDIVDAFCDL